jgi:hypothetical protein
MLLSICAAMGIAVALAVALNKPIPPPKKRGSEVASPVTMHPAVVQALPPSPTPAHEPTPVVAPYRDAVARQVGQLEDSIQELEESSHRRERSMLRAIAAIQDRIDDPPPRAPAAPAAPAAPPADDPPAEADQLPPGDATPDVPAARKINESHADVRRGEGDDNLSINIQNTDIRAVLEMISRETGLNIMSSRKVTGPVTANLTGVDLETALAAILKSTGFAAAHCPWSAPAARDQSTRPRSEIPSSPFPAP